MASISYLQVKQGSTGVRAVVVMENPASGGVVAALPTSLVYYGGFSGASATTVALTAGTLGTWASATAVIVTGMTGYYEIGIPDAAFVGLNRQLSMQFFSGTNEGSLLFQVVPYDISIGVNVAGYSSGQDPYTKVMKTVDSVDALTNADTLEKRIRIFASALLGKVSGMGTSAPIFRDILDTKNRITATTDSIGNRTVITLDGS